jgi:hypothetical protein
VYWLITVPCPHILKMKIQNQKLNLLNTRHNWILRLKPNFFHGSTAPNGPGLLIFEAWQSHSDIPHSVGLLWTRDLYLTTHNTHNTQTTIPPAGFEPSIPASERPQTHALDRATIEIGVWNPILVAHSCIITIKRRVLVVISVFTYVLALPGQTSDTGNLTPFAHSYVRVGLQRVLSLCDVHIIRLSNL